MNTNKLIAILALAAVSAFVALQPTAAGAEPSGKTVEKGLVILIEFSDVKHNITRNLVQKRFSDHLDSYIREMSYNRVSLDVDVTRRWFTMPAPVSQYRISPRNLEVDKSRVRRLIDDALNAVDKDVDFSKYTFVAVFMGAAVSDYGMVGLCGYPGMLGWSVDGALRTRSGQMVRGVAIFTSQAHLGTLFHDTAHILGGIRGGVRAVPCLYDHDLQAKPGPPRETAIDAMINVGFWDPMSCHFYERRLPPPGISSWTRLRLGWLDQSKIVTVKPGETAEVTLGPLETGSSETLAIRIPISQTAYYLVENRQPIGFDRNLPGSGVLIMYADDAIPECRHGAAPVKLVDANPAAPHLEGAAFDIGKRESYQDNRNRITIQLKEKIGGSYKILVSRR